jgi:hypothetical protein
MAFHRKDPASNNAAGDVVRPPKKVAPSAMVIKNPIGQGYGTNSGANNPSSVDPHKLVESTMAGVLREAQDDGEHVLDSIIDKGSAAMGPDFQTRPMDTTQHVPTSPGMRSRTAAKEGGSVPAKTGYVDKDPGDYKS